MLRNVLIFLLCFPVSAQLQLSEQDWYVELMRQSRLHPQSALLQTREWLAQTAESDWQRRYHLTNALGYQLLILADIDQAEAVVRDWLTQVPAEQTQWQIRSYELLGLFAYRRNEYGVAQHYLQHAHQLAQQHQDYHRIASITINSALLVGSIGLYQEATLLLQQAEQLAEQHGLDASTKSISRNNMSSMLVLMQKYEAAIDHLNESLQLDYFQQDDIAFVHRTLASSHLALQQYDAAADFANKALVYYLQRDDPISINELYLLKAELALVRGQPAEAEQKLRQVWQQLSAHKLPSVELKATLLQSKLYQQQQRYEPALQAMQRYSVLYSQSQNEQSHRNVLRLRDQLQFQQQQQAITELENQLLITELQSKHQHKQNITIISSLSAMSLLLIFFFWQQQKKRIQAEQLSRQLRHSLQQLQLAQQQLIESEKMASLGGLVAGLAHEMNTPLGILTTAISLLDEQLAAFTASVQSKQLTQQKFISFCEKSGETLKLSQQTVQRCSNLVINIKKLAISQEQQSEVNLGNLVASVQTIMKGELQGVDVQLKGTDLMLRCSGQQLQMVLLELFQNSVQHGFAEVDTPQIRLEAELQKTQLLLRYADNGRGIAAEEREHVFEPFYTTARGKGQTGLGLNLVYNLMTHAFGGSVELTASQTGFELVLHFPSSILCYAPDAASCSNTRQPME